MKENFRMEKPPPTPLTQRLIDLLINHRGWFKYLVQKKRDDLLAAEDRKSLNDKLWRMHKPLAWLYKLNLPGQKKDWDVLKRLEFFRAFIQGRTLDVGCEDGFFVRALSHAGHHIQGVDCLKALVDYCLAQDPDGSYSLAYAEHMSFRASTFDTVIVSHVLEHVFSPAEVMKEIQRIVKPGGQILIVVPYGYGNEPNHLRAFDKKNLLDLANEYFSVRQYFPYIGNGHGLKATYTKKDIPDTSPSLSKKKDKTVTRKTSASKGTRKRSRKKPHSLTDRERS